MPSLPVVIFFFVSHADDWKISATAGDLRQGLTALQFQDSVVDRTTPPSSWVARAYRYLQLGWGPYDSLSWRQLVSLHPTVTFLCNEIIMLGLSDDDNSILRLQTSRQCTLSKGSILRLNLLRTFLCAHPPNDDVIVIRDGGRRVCNMRRAVSHASANCVCVMNHSWCLLGCRPHGDGRYNRTGAVLRLSKVVDEQQRVAWQVSAKVEHFKSRMK